MMMMMSVGRSFYPPYIADNPSGGYRGGGMPPLAAKSSVFAIQ